MPSFVPVIEIDGRQDKIYPGTGWRIFCRMADAIRDTEDDARAWAQRVAERANTTAGVRLFRGTAEAA